MPIAWRGRLWLRRALTGYDDVWPTELTASMPAPARSPAPIKPSVNPAAAKPSAQGPVPSPSSGANTSGGTRGLPRSVNLRSGQRDYHIYIAGRSIRP